MAEKGSMVGGFCRPSFDRGACDPPPAEESQKLTNACTTNVMGDVEINALRVGACARVADEGGGPCSDIASH